MFRRFHKEKLGNKHEFWLLLMISFLMGITDEGLANQSVIKEKDLSPEEKLILAADDEIKKGNPRHAIEILLPLSQEGYSEALNMLGEIYHLQKDIQDYRLALHYYRQASDRGHKIAPNHLARMYLHGEGVKKDSKEALKWYIVSASRGYPLAQYNVGYCYEHGIGTEIKLERAGAWYGLAEKNAPGLLKDQFYGSGEGVTFLNKPQVQ